MRVNEQWLVRGGKEGAQYCHPVARTSKRLYTSHFYEELPTRTHAHTNRNKDMGLNGSDKHAYANSVHALTFRCPSSVVCTHTHKHKHTSTYTVCQYKKTRSNRELFCVEEADFHAACWFTEEQERLVSSSSWANNTTSPAVIYMDCVCVCVDSGVSCCCSSSLCSRKCRWQGNQRQRERQERQVKEHSFR